MLQGEVAPAAKILLERPLCSYPEGKVGTRLLAKALKEALRLQMAHEGCTRLRVIFKTPRSLHFQFASCCMILQRLGSLFRTVGCLIQTYCVFPLPHRSAP